MTSFKNSFFLNFLTPSRVQSRLIKTYLSFLMLGGVIILSIGGCSHHSPPPMKYDFIVFGTEVQLTLYPQTPASGHQAIEAIQSRFYQFHQDWHAWETGGIIGKINAAIKMGLPIKISADVKRFILMSQDLAKKSDYLFDPGIGSLIALWGFHSENWQGPPPSQADRKAWLAKHPSIANISFDGLTLSSSNPDVSLDFGGNAKGLALQIAMATLKKAGIENAIVNIGGDMTAIGSKMGRPWSVGIQNPSEPSQAIARLKISDESVVTSGNYQRYFEWQGKKYSHIINPTTAWPADSFASVTVIHPNAIVADSAATAIMIAGPNAWKEIAKNMGVKQVFAIDTLGKHYLTASMAKRIELFPTK